MSFTFKDNSDEFINEIERKIEKALTEVGLVAEGEAKLNLENHVITGRLRNSITFATKNNKGQDTYRDNSNKSYSGGSAKGTPEKNVVYIGSNVEYSAFVEYGARGRRPVHYLKNAVANNTDKYKQIINDELKA